MGHVMLSCHVVMSFCHVMLSCHVVIPCCHVMLSCHFVMSCCHAMLSCQVVMSCYHVMLSCHVVMSCCHVKLSCHVVMSCCHGTCCHVKFIQSLHLHLISSSTPHFLSYNINQLVKYFWVIILMNVTHTAEVVLFAVIEFLKIVEQFLFYILFITSIFGGIPLN